MYLTEYHKYKHRVNTYIEIISIRGNKFNIFKINKPELNNTYVFIIFLGNKIIKTVHNKETVYNFIRKN